MVDMEYDHLTRTLTAEPRCVQAVELAFDGFSGETHALTVDGRRVRVKSHHLVQHGDSPPIVWVETLPA